VRRRRPALDPALTVVIVNIGSPVRSRIKNPQSNPLLQTTATP
jgi:hypothetical protein